MRDVADTTGRPRPIDDAMTTARAMTFSSALARTRVRARATTATATTRATGRARTTIESLGGFGPNIDAKEIQRRMAEKQKKIDENKRKAASGTREASTAFGARKEFQRTISSARPSRAGRTMPGGGKAAATTSSKAKTVSGKAKEEAPKKKLFGLF